MKAKMKVTAKISPNGYDCLKFNKGDIVEGKVAIKAVESGLADELSKIKAPEVKKPAAPKVKKKKK